MGDADEKPVDETIASGTEGSEESTDDESSTGESSATETPADQSSDFDLPAVLARLDDDSTAETRRAIGEVRAVVEAEPTRCVPTVPKLRQLLDEPRCEETGDVAYCLAELARVAPEDVAPSAPTIASFVEDADGTDGVAEGLRCLSEIAAETPEAVIEHVDSVLVCLEETENHRVRTTAVETLQTLAAHAPEEFSDVQSSFDDVVVERPPSA